MATPQPPPIPSHHRHFDHPLCTTAQHPTMARRSSRADPIIRTDDEPFDDDDGYGELGQRHPLRRVKDDLREEMQARQQQVPGGDAISLPGIKALLGGAADPPPALNPVLFQSPSLPSLVPNSPTSPSTAASGRTSRFSSLTSSSAAAEPSAPAPAPAAVQGPGWWRPEFNGNPFAPAPSFRSNTLTRTLQDEHDTKRRRSDGPLPSVVDNEEHARLKWQAQSRNASFPSASPSGSSGPTTPTNWQGRASASLQPAPAPVGGAGGAGVSAAMSRSSLSGRSGSDGGVSPPLSRRTSPRSRNGSLVSGQLASHFADLSANSPRGSLSAPSSAAERRLSVHPPPFLGTERRASSLLRPLSTPDSEKPLGSSLALSIPNISRPSSAASEALLRPSHTQPSTPAPAPAPESEVRRSSLSDMIRAQSGDDVAMKEGKYLAERSPLSDPVLRTSPQSVFLPLPVPSGEGGVGGGRRESTESISSGTANPGISLDAERTFSGRGKKRSVEERDDPMSMSADSAVSGSGSGSGSGDPGMRGMEVLAEEALRAAQEEEGKRASNGEASGSGEEEEGDEDMEEERDSPGKAPGSLGLGSGAGVGGGSGMGGPKYTCSYCAKSFSRPSSLKIHTHSHTGERPYVCHEPGCGRRFSVQSNLKRHAKVHQVGAGAGGAGGGGTAGKEMPVTTTAPAPGSGHKALPHQPPHHGHSHGGYQGQPQGQAHLIHHPNHPQGAPHPYAHPHAHSHTHSHPQAHSHGHPGQHPIMHGIPHPRPHTHGHMPPGPGGGYYFSPGYAPMPMGMAQPPPPPPPHPHSHPHAHAQAQGMGYYADPRYGMMHSPTALGPEGFGPPAGMPQVRQSQSQYGHYAEKPLSQSQSKNEAEAKMEAKTRGRKGSVVKGGKERRGRGTDGGIKEEEEE
ncbi:hypothetical protein IAR50_006898 [Cryptococcus sp. DSM 104548]